MEKQTKRICMAVIGQETLKDGQQLDVCGCAALEKPKALYVPLCAAHRALAEVRAIKVFTGKEIADYRL